LNNLHGLSWGTSNDCLFTEVVKELNKEFPDEKWALGEIPLYRWKVLNPPGFEPDDEDVANWKNDPNVYKDRYGRYIERSAKNIKCIHCSAAKSILERSKNDLNEFSKNCDTIAKYRHAYIVDDKIFVDHECSGGYDVAVNVKFIEGIEATPHGRNMTPREAIINNTIVREIDTRCANLQEVKNIHESLDYIEKELNEFITRYNLKQNPNQSIHATEEGM